MHAPVTETIEKGAGRLLRPGLDFAQQAVHGAQTRPLDRGRERLARASCHLLQEAGDRRELLLSKPLAQPGVQRVVAGQQHDGEPATIGVRFRKQRDEPGDRRLDGRRIGDREPAPALVADGAPQVVESFAPGCDRAEDPDAEPLLEPVAVDADADLGRLVVHVEIEREGEAQLGELGAQNQRPPQVLGVGHLHDGGRGLGEQDVAGHGLVLGHGEEAVDAGRIEHLVRDAVDLRLAARHGDRGARVVRYGDVASSEEAEEHALADVRVADQDDAGERSRGLVAVTVARPRREGGVRSRHRDVAVANAVAHEGAECRREGSVRRPSSFA